MSGPKNEGPLPKPPVAPASPQEQPAATPLPPSISVRPVVRGTGGGNPVTASIAASTPTGGTTTRLPPVPVQPGWTPDDRAFEAKVIAREAPATSRTGVPPKPTPGASGAAGPTASTTPNDGIDRVSDRPVPVPEEWANTPQREVPCPVCSGSILIKYAGRLFSSLIGWLKNAFKIRVEIIETIKNYVIERLPVSKRSLFREGKCGACGGKGTLVDVTDDRAKQAQAGSIAQGYQQELQENEAKLGTGGNEYKIVAGHVVHEIGLGMNDCPSYRQEPDKGARLKGMTVAGGILDPKAGALPEGGKCCVTVGVNPIASPGGQYTIKCSNKFALLTGALGVEITTGGPLTLKGGITRITGPEITIGTQTGTLGLEGEVINMVAKSIEMGPKDGQLIVKGSGGTTGNFTVGGHLHAESASIVKLETVGRNEPSKLSASTNLFSGPAFWGGQNPEGLRAALQELLGFVLSHVTNPELAKYIVSLRYADNLLDNEVNIAYMTQEAEPLPIGFVCNVMPGPARVPVFGFPHIHANFDRPHYHETRVPDIDCTSEDAKELRSKQIAQNSPAPTHKKSTSVLDVLRSIFAVIGLVFIPIWYPFTKNIQGKVIGGRPPC